MGQLALIDTSIFVFALCLWFGILPAFGKISASKSPIVSLLRFLGKKTFSLNLIPLGIRILLDSEVRNETAAIIIVLAVRDLIAMKISSEVEEGKGRDSLRNPIRARRPMKNMK